MSEHFSSPIRKFYAGRSVLITGATGFVGICLIEKILRDLPDVENLYLLMRPKKGKNIQERLEDLTKNPVFQKLLEKKARDVFLKLIPIQGDVGEENLGISDEDKIKLIDNVSVVFHSAATLDFFSTLRETTNINLRGTRRVVQLCLQMTNLKALVHVSSAYVNSYLLEAEEILYPCPEDPEKIIDLTETLCDEALKELEPKILKEHPNTYTFTKHLAEHEVDKGSKKFPCGIIRPSMITAAWKEPVPGWTISKNGPQGFFMGASKGVIRRLPLDPSLVMDYIPVDVVINQMIATGYYVNRLQMENNGSPGNLQIFHCTSSSYKPFRFASLSGEINTYMQKYPLKSAVWYPHLKLVKSLFLFRISAIFFHFIPGYFLDFITRIFGGRPILIKLHTNVWNSLSTLERFIFTEWKFDNKKTLAFSKAMDFNDNKIFLFDIGELNWHDYFRNMHLGVRQYLNNESLKTLDAARSKNRILLVLHILLQLVFYSGIWKLLGILLGLSNTIAALLLPIIYVLWGYL